jgi:predicted DNA-binding transcriptional regulator
MMDQGLIDKETFIRIYRYRLRAILRNGPIKRELLRVGREGEQRYDEEDKEPYEDFKKLVKEIDFSDERLQKMLRNPRGGSFKALTSSAPQQE